MSHDRLLREDRSNPIKRGYWLNRSQVSQYFRVRFFAVFSQPHKTKQGDCKAIRWRGSAALSLPQIEQRAGIPAKLL